MKSIIMLLFPVVLLGILASSHSVKTTCVTYEYTKGLSGYLYSVISSLMKFS